MMGMMGFADIQRFLNDIIHTSRHQQRECSGILFFQVLETRALLCNRTTEDVATRAPSQREYISRKFFLFNTPMMMVICNDNHYHNLQDRGQRESFFESRDENENLTDSISHIETRPRISDT